MLTHHQLKVYEKALVLAAGAEALSAGGGKQHAIVEHFRAMGVIPSWITGVFWRWLPAPR